MRLTVVQRSITGWFISDSWMGGYIRQKNATFKEFEDLRQLGAFMVRSGAGLVRPTRFVESKESVRQPSAYRLGRGVVDPFLDCRRNISVEQLEERAGRARY